MRPRHGLALIVGVGFSLVAASLTAAPSFECRWAASPPIIDGRADEAVWQQAAVVDRFAQSWLAGAPAAKQGTRVRLLWDREYIYFFAEMDDTDVTAEVREHDGPLWRNDVFEIFLKPSEQHAGYYEFEVNPFEAVFDAFFPTPESRRDPAQIRRDRFHVEAKVVVHGTLNNSTDRDTGWSVEGRIPWSDLNATGGRPAPGETWGVNLARVDGKDSATELSSAAPLTQPSFHRTEEYASLLFVGPTPIPHAAWQNSRLIGTPDGPSAYVASRAWPRLEAFSLVALTPAPGREWLWFIDQEAGWGGRMRLGRLRAAGDGSDAENLLELDDFAYDIAFHPRFAENGFVFIGMNGPREAPPRFTRIVRYTVRDGRPDPASRTVIIEWSSDGHNGGDLAFASDGTLFLTSGDGSSCRSRTRTRRRCSLKRFANITRRRAAA